MTDTCWKIGVLFSRSGVTAAAETSEANAVLLAVEQINEAGGILGREIEPIIYDPACSIKKTTAARRRRDLVSASIS